MCLSFPSYGEAEIGRITVLGQLGPYNNNKFARPHLNGKKAGCGGTCLSFQQQQDA
jgi:hypothetical protein